MPRVRDRRFESMLWERHKRRQRAVDRVILEGFLLGHSTRKTTRLFKRVFKRSISPQVVSNVVKYLEEGVKSFRSQRIEDCYRFLILDGLFCYY